MLFWVWDNNANDECELVEAASKEEAIAKAAGPTDKMAFGACEAVLSELTLHQLQKHLPWGLNDYSEVYGDDRAPHRDYRHASMHLAKAAGILLVTPEEMDHDPSLATAEARRIEDTKRLADVVIVALRMASTHPSGPIVLAEAIQQRLHGKREGK